jgi:dipeptidyl aminopeptidase/acylaminoacyl peptidase
MSLSSETPTLPYGSWPSPITAADIAEGTTPLYFPGFAETAAGEEVWWVEGRPQDDGRFALVARSADGSDRDVVATRWNVRTRIHEYGARPWAHVPSSGAVFTFWDDQRLYLMPDGSSDPTPLTSAPTDAVTHMYGEPVAAPDGSSVWVIRETQRRDEGGVEIHRAIVRVPLDGSGTDDDAVTVLADGHRFFAFPRPSADGRRIAYIAWDHPQMPWDGTLLYVADVADGIGSNARLLAGSTTESLLQPEWADDSTLYAISDRTGWWNLYRFGADDGSVEALCPREEEFAQPLWLLGFATYGVLGDGRLAVLHGVGRMDLGVLDPADGRLTPVDTGMEFGEEMAVSGTRVVNEAGSLTTSGAITVVDVASGQVEVVRSSSSLTVDPAYLPEAFPLTVEGPFGPVHAWVFPPRSPDAVAPEGELPPYLAMVHGGPTAHVTPRMSILKAYYTSRGIGVIDVNYGGSTGYGREYRERLREQWGIVDVQDTVAAVDGLAKQGLADPARLGIVGGSAGGWTTLAALVFADTFACGAAYFPVTDLLPFAEITHDFESRYLDGLVGPLPQERQRYVDRSPMTHLDNLHVPVILLQGDDDKVVPPSQPAAVAEALARKGIPHKYLLFAGEQHGFRKAENQITALESELSFWGQVFGFVPPGVPTLQLDSGPTT